MQEEANSSHVQGNSSRVAQIPGMLNTILVSFKEVLVRFRKILVIFKNIPVRTNKVLVSARVNKVGYS